MNYESGKAGHSYTQIRSLTPEIVLEFFSCVIASFGQTSEAEVYGASNSFIYYTFSISPRLFPPCPVDQRPGIYLW